MICSTLLWITQKLRWGVGGGRGVMESATYPCSSRPHLWHRRWYFSNGVMDLGLVWPTKASTEVRNYSQKNTV